MRRQLEGCDRLIARKNQEFQAMGGVLAAANQKISDRDADIERLETELSDLKQNLAPSRDLPEAADLLNQLKTKRKKSTASLADIDAILEMIEG